MCHTTALPKATPRTRTERSVDVLPALRDDLATHALRDSDDPEAFVFATATGGAQWQDGRAEGSGRPGR